MRPSLAILRLLGFLPLVARAWAAHGNLLWQDLIDRGHDDAASISGRHDRVFAAGLTFGNGIDQPDISFVRAYHAKTGALLWEQLSAPHAIEAYPRLAVADHKVFVSDGALVHAHHASTGSLIWQQNAGGTLTAIEASGGLVVVVGYKRAPIVPPPASGPTENVDLLISAYDAGSGSLVWSDQFDSGNNNGDWGFALRVHNNRAYAVGKLEQLGGARSALVRAYKAHTGDLLWSQTSPALESASAVTSHGGLVFIGGTTGQSTNPGIQAYDAQNGVLVWQHEAIRGDGIDAFGFIAALDVQQDRLVAAGSDGRFLVQAHEPSDGSVLWKTVTAHNGAALALTTHSGQVFTVGMDKAPDLGWVVRAQDGATGQLAWEKLEATTTVRGIGRDVDVEGGRLFAIGSVGMSEDAGFPGLPNQQSDVLIRTYDAK